MLVLHEPPLAHVPGFVVVSGLVPQLPLNSEKVTVKAVPGLLESETVIVAAPLYVATL